VRTPKYFNPNTEEGQKEVTEVMNKLSPEVIARLERMTIEPSFDCVVCGKPLIDGGVDWYCENKECNIITTHYWNERTIDMTDLWRNKLRDLVSRIRPDVEVAGWVYQELEKLSNDIRKGKIGTVVV